MYLCDIVPLGAGQYLENTMNNLLNILRIYIYVINSAFGTWQILGVERVVDSSSIL